jgi:hypothetical protein
MMRMIGAVAVYERRRVRLFMLLRRTSGRPDFASTGAEDQQFVLIFDREARMSNFGRNDSHPPHCLTGERWNEGSGSG